MNKDVIGGLNCYVKQIITKRYNYYIITDHLFVLTVNLKDQVMRKVSVTAYFTDNI